MFDHGALTDVVLAHLTAAVSTHVTSSALPLVGDGIAPTDGGWINGQPGDGVFRPYVVVVSGGAAPRNLDVSQFDPGWAVSLSLRSFGGSRKQCDWMATLARTCISTIYHTDFGQGWQIIGVEWGSLGPVSRIDATAPAFWQVFDNLTLVTSS